MEQYAPLLVSPSSSPELVAAAELPSSTGVEPISAGVLSAPVPTTHWIGCHRLDLEECGSTNDEAARLARAGARHGTLVVSRIQTAGRGRAGRAWTSPAGNLYMSLVLRPALLLRDVPAMTLAIGVAVCETARSLGIGATLKWPNDVLVGQRKLAGVLLESQSRGERLDVVIAGIGINLDAPPDPSAAPLATWVTRELGRPVDREGFLARLLAAIEHWVDRYVACGLPGVIPAFTALMDQHTRAQTRIAGQLVTGVLEGIDDVGALLLRADDGLVHRVIAGDVETVRTEAVPALTI
ncbi:MAG: biotin--[acetyl-CoA-carboxylase] ligase [Myxococcales bacterium]|nr:biotin--[acetyl-CoA-carboxylase] ligase [Myxococcales bacterium]HRC59132.1 biotin--[acetyl-CoA-carboxylase] ligase [Kofleriaceae bacterium]